MFRGIVSAFRGRPVHEVALALGCVAGGAWSVGRAYADFRGEPSTVPYDQRFINPERERKARSDNVTPVGGERVRSREVTGDDAMPAGTSRDDYRTTMSGSTRQTRHSVQQTNVPNWYQSERDPGTSGSMQREDAPIASRASTTATAGGPVSLASKAVDVATGILQSFRPISAVREHISNVLQHRGDTSRQLVVHEYVAHLSEDFGQVLLFDSDAADARLIGVQYLISERLYNMLPDSEKQLWTDMEFAVRCGAAMAPGVPSFAERTLMSRLAMSHAKSWIFWHVDDGHNVPLGGPALVDPYTRHAHVNHNLLNARDESLGIARQMQRTDIAVSAPRA